MHSEPFPSSGLWVTHWRWAIGRENRLIARSGVSLYGRPLARDERKPCAAYEPRKLEAGETRQCDGDGHRLCSECCWKKE